MTNINNPDFEAKHDRAATGEFTEMAHSAPETALTTAEQEAAASRTRRERAIKTLQENVRIADEFAAAATQRGRELTAQQIHFEIQNKFEGAATAILAHFYDANDDSYSLHTVTSADGTVLYDSDTDDELVADFINTLAWKLGDEANTYFDYVEVEDGDGVTVDLTAEPADLHFNAEQLIPFKHVGPGVVLQVAAATSYESGQIGGWMNNGEVEYRLLEEPENYGITEDTVNALLAANDGDRNKAVKAVIETAAWSKFDEEVTEKLNDDFTDSIKKALRELHILP